tara:strand:- start:11840 stop:14035 length:2196 start_codon:yes stop_codon:yes gene_type:complete
MATREEQTQRRMAIELLNAQTRAAELEQKKRQFAQDYSDGRVIQPNEDDILATYAEGMSPDIGTEAGGAAYLQGVNYMSPDAAPAFSPVGGASDMDAPTGPIEPEIVAPEENLEDVEGYTDVYYDSVKKLNDIASFAASNGINIKSPDPDSEDQRNLSNYYNKLYTETMYLADNLKQGYEARKMGAEKGYRPLLPKKEPLQFQDLVPDEVKSIEKFNSSVKTDGYTDYSAYKATKERYDQMRANLEEIIKWNSENNNTDVALKYAEHLESLKRPLYNGNVQKRLELDKKKLDLDKDKWSKDYYKNFKKMRQAADIVVMTANAFANKASYELDPVDGKLYNRNFQGLKYGKNKTIDKLEMLGFEGLSPQEWVNYSTLEENITELNAKIDGNEGDTSKEEARLAELKLKKAAFTKKFGDKTPVIKVHWTTQSSSGEITGEGMDMSKMTEVTASGSDVIGGMKSFLNVLTEYNGKLVDGDAIIDLGLKGGWLTTTGDYNPDKILGGQYKKLNKEYNAFLMAANGNYSQMYENLQDKLQNPQDWDQYTDFFYDNYEQEDIEDGRQHMFFDLSNSDNADLRALGSIYLFKSESDGNDENWDLVYSPEGEVLKDVDDDNAITRDKLSKLVGGDRKWREIFSGNNTIAISDVEVVAFLQSAKILENTKNVVESARKVNTINEKYKKSNLPYKNINQLLREFKTSQTVAGGGSGTGDEAEDEAGDGTAVEGFGKQKKQK